MARAIAADEIPKDDSYEPPLSIEFGINDVTVGSEKIVMGRTVIPPGQKSKPHTHLNCEASQYVISGHLRVWTGIDPHVLAPQDVPPGYFCYVPRGEVHCVENVSDSEPVVL